ncbi:MAG: hypothetical protein AAF745_13750 [Planctomycetota bacterium]
MSAQSPASVHSLKTSNPPESHDPILPPESKLPFVLLTSCFLWWAIANNLTDPLVTVFKEIFGMSTAQAALIQMAFYGFGLGCANLGDDTKLASSGQIMAIVGGAVITPAQGYLEDSFGVYQSYLLPLACFVVIALYAIYNRTSQSGSPQSRPSTPLDGNAPSPSGGADGRSSTT